jgi:hypothetical protein
VLGIPLPASSAQQSGQISGIARTRTTGQPLVGYTAQLRDTTTNAIIGTTKTTKGGAFAFTGVPPGSYIVEIVDSANRVLGTSTTVRTTPAAMLVSGVVVTIGDIGGVAAVAGGGGIGAFFTSTTGIVVLAAAGVGLGVGIYYAVKSDTK